MGDHDAEARPIYHCPGLQTLILMLISVGLMMLILCWIMVRDWGVGPRGSGRFCYRPWRSCQSGYNWVGESVSDIYLGIVGATEEAGKGNLCSSPLSKK